MVNVRVSEPEPSVSPPGSSSAATAGAASSPTATSGTGLSKRSVTATATATAPPLTVRAGSAVTAKRAGGPATPGTTSEADRSPETASTRFSPTRLAAVRVTRAPPAGPVTTSSALRTVPGVSVESRTTAPGTGVPRSSMSSIRISADPATGTASTSVPSTSRSGSLPTQPATASRPPTAAHARSELRLRLPSMAPLLTRKIRRTLDSTIEPLQAMV